MFVIYGLRFKVQVLRFRIQGLGLGMVWAFRGLGRALGM